MKKPKRSLKLDRAVAKCLTGNMDLPPAYSSQWGSASQILDALFKEDSVVAVEIFIEDDLWCTAIEVEASCPENGTDSNIRLIGYGQYPQMSLCRAALHFYCAPEVPMSQK